jgi:hypothetical protein
MALVALLGCLSSAQGSFSPRPEQPNPTRELRSRFLTEAVKPQPKDDDLVITDQTEVKLDGKLCSYKDVPGNAEIILLEVGQDKKEILKIHFRAQK